MTHRYIIGQTGTGKSTYALSEAIDHIRAGDGVSFFDPHGQTAKELLRYIPAGRIKDVIYVDPSDPYFTVAFNPIANGNYKVADDVVSSFRHRHVDSWGPKLEYIFRTLIHTLTFVSGSDLIGVWFLLYHEEYRRRAVSLISDPVLKLFWQNEFEEYRSARDYGAMTASPILNKVMPAITSPDLRAILCQPTSTLNFRDILDSKKVLIVNLAKGQLGETYSNILGAMLVSGISQAALSREDIPEDKRVAHYVFADEFHNFVTGSFAVILSESRKYKLYLYLIHQYLAQLPDDLRNAVFGNVSDIVSFRVGVDDALFIAKQIGWENPKTLLGLRNYRAMTTFLDPDGSPYPAHQIRPQPLTPPAESNAEEAIAWSNGHVARNRKDVEAAISRFIERMDPKAPRTFPRAVSKKWPLQS